MTEERIPLTQEESCDSDCTSSPLTRRDFLFASGASIVTVLIGGAKCGSMEARVANYPRKKIADIRKLKKGEPVRFRYPWDDAHCENVLLKLGESAAGGIGPQKDVVAFNRLCTHMGRAIGTGSFSSDTGVAGPCSWHWTTFDLTRHGMVVSGHATQGLPQILLELDGNDILATGVLGLMYGFHNNRVEPGKEGI